MAVRYAGDYFGISLADSGGKSSVLLDYYPELRSPAKKSEASPTGLVPWEGLKLQRYLPDLKPSKKNRGLKPLLLCSRDSKQSKNQNRDEPRTNVYA